MTLLDAILSWSEELTAWQRDALRRAFLIGGELSRQDLLDMRAMVEGRPEAPVPLPLLSSHVPTLGSGSSTLLTGLSNLASVNGFPDGRQLDIAEAGVTLIFGENGAGKSGFARVMKRACRARHSSAVLPNAFTSAATAAPSASFGYVVDGTHREFRWQEGRASDSDLAMVSVYDSQCAQDYIARGGPSTFVPFGFHALSALASAQQAVQEEISREISGIQLSPAQFLALQGRHTVGDMIRTLGPSTDLPSLRALATLNADELQSIADLSAAIKGLDVEPEATKHERLAQRLESLARNAVAAERFVTDAALDKFMGMACAEEEAVVADRLAQRLLHDESSSGTDAQDLLPETGGEQWKSLFHAARAFSVVAYPDHSDHPAYQPEDQCVLCQQILGEPAQDRLRRFHVFVAADAAKNLEAARRSVADARLKIESANLAAVEPATLDEIKQADEALGAAIIEHQTAWAARREWIETCYVLSQWTTPRPELPIGEALSVRLTAKAGALRELAERLRRSNSQSELADLKHLHAGLVARRDLGTHLPAIETYVQASLRRLALERARDALNTKAVSTKITALSKVYATDALATALNEELTALGYRRRVTPVLTSQTKGGRNLHGLALTGCKHGVHEVLSEGEQRAVALAFFLAEAKLRGDKSTIVFDDPSTSLDHLHRRRMAEHLVQLGSERPVVIFTHDAVFLTTLLAEIAEQQMPAKIQTVEWQAGSPGGLLDGLAWESKPYSDQMAHLKALAVQMKAAHNAYPSSADKREIRDAYGHMRGMVERAVREIILNDTVHPFSDEVRVIQVGAVAGFGIDDWRTIVSVYGKASEVIVGHDSPREGQYELPGATEFEADIATLEAVIRASEDRRRAFNKKEKQFMIDLRNKVRQG